MAEKNLALFEKLGVMSKEETLARAEAMHDQYAGMIEIELKSMIEMVSRQCIPAVNQAGLSLTLALSPSPSPSPSPNPALT